MPTRWTIALLALLSLGSTLAPRCAFAGDGFASFKFGMTPAQAQAAYGNQLQVRQGLDGAPEGADEDALVLRRATLFEERVEVTAFFERGGLSLIRLSFERPDKGNLDPVRAALEADWGAPIVTRGKLSPTKRKKEWAWPWEGAQLREVRDEDQIVYQRLDFSAAIRQRWITADAEICSILPSASTCAFPDRYCPQTSTEVRREHAFALGESEGTIRCAWSDGALQTVRVEVEKPDESAADWLLIILERRLGHAPSARAEGADEILERRRWDASGVELRLVRKSQTKTAEGWTGPVRYIRLERAPRPAP